MQTMKEGLDGVVAASTRLSMVDGTAGRLIIAGYDVDEIAPRATFEEVCFLLWTDRQPQPDELAAFRQDLASRRALPQATLDLLAAAARASTPAIDALIMAVPTLRLGRPENPEDDARTAVAAFPTIVGSYTRLREGKDPLPARSDLSHAAHYLYQLTGVEPSASQTRAVETYLNTTCEHGFNASTFTARVIVSTRSDVLSAVTGAVGALKGPLHGGAPGPALDMVAEIATPDRAEPVIRERLARGERLMGFGHRVYRTRDPRADVLAQAAEQFYQGGADEEFYGLAKGVEATALRLLAEYHPDRKLYTNVEFFTALLLHGVGLPSDLFTPTFAVARVAGWTAHCLEQLNEGRLIRPESRYVGPMDLKYNPSSRPTHSE